MSSPVTEQEMEVILLNFVTLTMVFSIDHCTIVGYSRVSQNQRWQKCFATTLQEGLMYRQNDFWYNVSYIL